MASPTGSSLTETLQRRKANEVSQQQAMVAGARMVRLETDEYEGGALGLTLTFKGRERLDGAKERLGGVTFDNDVNQIWDTHLTYGAKGNEKLVCVEAPGRRTFYEGDTGSERVVRVEFDSGTHQFYAGERHQEQLVRTELADGTKEHFKPGAHGQRLARRTMTDGSETEYEVRRTRSHDCDAVLAKQPCIWLACVHSRSSACTQDPL